MRDAVEFERRGIPAVVLANDVFRPIADATAELLGLPSDYVERAVVYLPHPTSILTRERVQALIDAHWDEILAKLTGRPALSADGASAAPSLEESPLELARRAVDAFAEGLRADGAELVLRTYEEGVLQAQLDIFDAAACEGGVCLLPAPQLEAMIAALVRPALPGLRAVQLWDPRDPT
ncbi:MAG TPA: hypothetical protein VNJ51_06815 [Candidatus Dormibacteraeota bacterium]|nr:hypothetical protein [Candidatus Dormibacteraeota bacterium]